MRFPNTVEINTFKAYINLSNVNNNLKSNLNINSINLDWNSNSPESLRFLSIKVLADNWMSINSNFFSSLNILKKKHKIIYS